MRVRPEGPTRPRGSRQELREGLGALRAGLCECGRETGIPAIPLQRTWEGAQAIRFRGRARVVERLSRFSADLNGLHVDLVYLESTWLFGTMACWISFSVARQGGFHGQCGVVLWECLLWESWPAVGVQWDASHRLMAHPGTN